MLDQLVESRSKVNDSKMRGGLFVMSSLAIIMILFGATIWSIFAKDLSIGNDNLQISTLVAPIPLAANEPEPEPAPKQEKKSEQPKVQKDTIAKRQTNTLRLDESPTEPPKNISVTKNAQKARPNAPFEISKGAETDVQGSPLERGEGKPGGTGGDGISPTGNNTKPVEPEVIEKPIPKPPIPPKPTPKATPKLPTIISGGVVNGKAINLPVPPYPAAARAVGAKGAVNVQVTIDENGNVISATAVSGPAILRSAAVTAARNAKFRPTTLSDQPVKVSGVIIYNFTG